MAFFALSELARSCHKSSRLNNVCNLYHNKKANVSLLMVLRLIPRSVIRFFQRQAWMEAISLASAYRLNLRAQARLVSNLLLRRPETRESRQSWPKCESIP